MCLEESRGVNPSEFLLDQAKGESSNIPSVRSMSTALEASKVGL